MKSISKLLLPAMVATALSGAALAQDRECIELEGAPPGLYTTTDEGRVFVVKDGEILELGPGEAGYAGEGKLGCIRRPPRFLDWPCSTDAARSRMFNTYSISDIAASNRIKEIVQRYFEVPEVIAPVPSWEDGEYHGEFDIEDIIQFSSPDYWYQVDDNTPVLSGKRPRSLLVSLFVGTNQVVLDNNMLDELRQELGSDTIPVTFVFNDSNSVPVSYFGSNVSLEEVLKAFTERGIKLASVPLWWQGDHHLRPTIEEFEKFFDIPALEDISEEKRAALRADLEAFGFSRKPVMVSLFADSGTMAVDQPARVRVAASMGYTQIPTNVFFVEPDVVLARCGPGTPVGSSGVSGSTTPTGGATVPPGGVVPPPVEPPASDS